MITLTEAQAHELREQLGEGFHAGFRKASDHPASAAIWRLIRDLPDEEYRNVIDFVVWGITGIDASSTNPRVFGILSKIKPKGKRHLVSVVTGRIGGRSTSKAKIAAARANGAKGGRPRKKQS